MKRGSIGAYVHVTVLPRLERDVLSLMSEIKRVRRANSVTGGGPLTDGIMVEVYMDNEKDFYETIDEIETIRGVQKTIPMMIVRYKKE